MFGHFEASEGRALSLTNVIHARQTVMNFCTKFS